MRRTAEGLVDFVIQQIGTPYVYGAKGQIVTDELISLWAKESPNVYTSTYKAKARRYKGQIANDCSGLISRYTGVLRGSANFYDTATERLPISQINDSHIGWAVWKRGHIGVYIGGGMVVEARGIDYGTIKVERTSNAWTHVIKLKDIDYGAQPTKVEPTNQNTSGFLFGVIDYQKWINKYYGKLLIENFGKKLVEDNIQGINTRNAGVCIWKYRINKKNLGYTFDTKNTNFGTMCIKLGNAQIVKKGKKTRDVYIVQGILRAKGYYKGSLDGDCGNMTDKAIRDYQRDNSLTVDGECGSNTWNKLFNS